jgi:hypothetical protein
MLFLILDGRVALLFFDSYQGIALAMPQVLQNQVPL